MSTPNEAQCLADLLTPHITPTRQISPAVTSAAIMIARDGLLRIAERERAGREILRDVSHALQTRAAERRSLSPEGCVALAADIDRVLWCGPSAAPGAAVIAMPVRHRTTIATGCGPEDAA